MSLISGWLPTLVQLVAIAVLITAVGWRSRQWRIRWLPAALMTGLAVAAAVRLFVKYQGWSETAASWATVFWNVMTGAAIAILVLGWRGVPWWRRTASVLAVPLCLLSAALALNSATGFLPTVGSAWQLATGSRPEQWMDRSDFEAMVQDGAQPTRGTLVWIGIPADASGFDHRQELVYLPPAWFRSNPPPQLPVVMMLGGELSQPADWRDAGRALETLDEFAALHRGYTPVVVFPDTTGALSNDTECVNGPRGNAADHIVKDVVPYVIANFGISADPANWGLAGWSTGGTCAVMTAVRHPELFSAFVDLDGQLGPNTGTKRQTIGRLFGGDADAWAAFDPKTVIEKHGPYANMAAWLGVSEESPTEHRAATDIPPAPEEIADWDTYSEEHAANARKMCALLSGHNVECAVVGYGGSHDFQSAAKAFASALPWLASRLGTPEVSKRSLPGS